MEGSASDLAATDRSIVWHPYAAMPNRSRVYPVVGAHGVRLAFADGRQVIDGMSSWWAAIHGYDHPVLNGAITAQLETLAHVMFGGLTHPAAITLAQRLVAITPAPLSCVFFCDSGSVAVEVAMKIAIQHWAGRGQPGKQRFLAPRRGYHGDTFGAMSVCDPVTGMHHVFAGALTRQFFADPPEPGFDEEVGAHHLASMRAQLREHGDEIAAVILEPVVQGTGGMRFYAPGYLRHVRALCDEYHVLLIADEIATGFGRTGTLFGCDHAGISPDVLCVGKALTGGYLSMAATLTTADVAAAVSNAEPQALMHGPTFMGNPLAAAVATASIDLLLGQDWRANVQRIERALQAGLAPARELRGVADVRVLGGIGVIEAHQPLEVDRIQAALIERGVWLRPFGTLLYTMPPYVIDDADLAHVTAAMVAAARMLT